jgi:hypothetical protein
MSWVAIRGPVGGPRWDFYTAYVAMHAGGPYAKKVDLSQFSKFPWVASEPPG